MAIFQSMKIVLCKFSVLFFFYSISSSCTGSIISKSVILTAAHCVNRGPRDVYITFGNSNLGNAMDMPVKSILIHPDFHNNDKWSENRHDLALLKLSNNLKFDDAIQPISLPSSNYHNYNLFSGDLIFAGYGSEEINTKQAERIQYVAVKYKYFMKTRTKDVNVMKKIKVYLTMTVCNSYPNEVQGEKQTLLFFLYSWKMVRRFWWPINENFS